MIITIANEKGGVGKSTTTVALGSVLAKRGYRVVMVDLDSQSDLTVSLGKVPGDRNTFDCIFTHKNILATRVNPKLVLVGGDPRMIPIRFKDQVENDPQFQYENPRLVLRDILGECRKNSDFILLDCPPNLDLITQNALACSDYLLIPTEPHNFSINGIRIMLDTALGFSSRLNESLAILGVFLTRFRASTSMHSDVHADLTRLYPEHMLKSVIHENVTVQEATHVGVEFEEYEIQKSKQALIKKNRPFRGLEDYRSLADEILDKINYAHFKTKKS